ncbi:hypothetical protein [Mycetocola saprophilus]|uniref:hypothetical protein n=1 Tax=Mycetocola saprophilus TaxID=76636 RepID=UPI003BF3D16A
MNARSVVFREDFPKVVQPPPPLWKHFWKLVWIFALGAVLWGVILGLMFAHSLIGVLLLLSYVLTLSAYAWYLAAIARTPQTLTARISRRHRFLRFVAPRNRVWAQYVWLFAAYSSWLALEIYTAPNPVASTTARSLIITAAFLLALSEPLRTQFHPAGLTLTPDYIIGVRGSGSVRIRWATLYRVRAAGIYRFPLRERGIWLYLTEFGHREVKINARCTATDVNILYWTVVYFWEHPEERELLSDPAAALRRVEEHHVGRTPVPEGSDH